MRSKNESDIHGRTFILQKDYFCDSKLMTFKSQYCYTEVVARHRPFG
uniref:Uncharacterized protein n=1 Tax=Rhizophora mucronata TaxID=61149 RepID=A0A2P2QAL6_RHIMU